MKSDRAGLGRGQPPDFLEHDAHGIHALREAIGRLLMPRLNIHAQSLVPPAPGVASEALGPLEPESLGQVGPQIPNRPAGRCESAKGLLYEVLRLMHIAHKTAGEPS
ncbi:MAG: hypothetical protein ACJA2W_001641 [Planctomycetota bacterium]